MTKTRKSLSSWWLGGLLAGAAFPSAAVTVTLDTDAFNLAAALAPAPAVLTSVTGDFVEVGFSDPGKGAIGTFTDGLATLGFDSGIVLSTGNAAEIFTGAPPTSGVDFRWVPPADTAGLLDQVPGAGSGYFDTVRFSLTIDPGFDANFVNFDLAYGTNELALSADRLGIFVNGRYFGLLAGDPIDQNHPWVGPAGSGFGFGSVLYPNGDVLAAPFVTLSVPVPYPASTFTLDLVVADVTDGDFDSAVFLGNLNGSETPLGLLLSAVPEPGSLLLLMAGVPAAAAFGLGRRRRRPAPRPQ
jgi:hypothetical protein